ncbi:MAG: hypothetical protein KDB03_21995, partial [Planctomycetales bacterium]|nr:hypothetical protein [Planctomycetales bacterium]
YVRATRTSRVMKKSICKVLWTISNPKRQSVSERLGTFPRSDASGYFFSSLLAIVGATHASQNKKGCLTLRR